ncbi:hypothetical protein KFE26_08505 [Shewanella sp. M16]|uniref:hypothetical protein n=1 Tax=Shewanella sp. M16 TaxID=2830837 RepID=UPI001BAF60A0|nr:hypothetical protein [Shewanella sp. M16]MBS0042349.1 hypothetical protein [Shewanella sp. M16]
MIQSKMSKTPVISTIPIDRTFSIAPMLDWTDFIVFSGLQASMGAMWGLSDLFCYQWGTVK